MPTFAFSGRTRGGETINGERIADNVDAAVAALRREQVLLLEGRARLDGQPVSLSWQPDGNELVANVAGSWTM